MVLDGSCEVQVPVGGAGGGRRNRPMGLLDPDETSALLPIMHHLTVPSFQYGAFGEGGLDFVEGGATFEHAVSETGFGRFHYGLMALCGLVYLDTAMGITILSFVLPAAQCDFDMDSPKKGWLNAAPMLGMVLGSYFWGCLADTRGRRVVLIATLAMDGLCGLASSISQYYGLFMFFRFLNGFAITGAMGIVFPYLGEFQPTRYREKILCWMELFWTCGIILLPGVAWLTIPLPLRYESAAFTFGSWQLFVAVCALPSLVIAAWLALYPESPKFLLECGEYEEALEILQDMFHRNTGRPREEYSVKSLREPRSRAMSVVSTTSRVSVKSLRSIRTPKDIKLLVLEVWDQTKQLCRPPHRYYTILTCLIQFGLTTSYYTLMMWFPELFDRFEYFSEHHPGETASVCEVSGAALANENNTVCPNKIDDQVFLHTLIVGLACIPTSFWLPLCVHRLGAKFFLVFSLVVSGLVAVGLYFVTNSTQNLVLSCIFEALTSLGISTVYCVMVDLFPTNLRVMAAALSLTFGRGGALFGNLVFSYLIDINCVLPIALFAALLFGKRSSR
ncbi:Synaptic vesicle glycoprotein 2B [Frankliniella fusca]|uniref:Synaptic vesicle glycoprotein 2B n=1 Tax=Frankliniella fusca TaxID=407009 RepID=A0AAE1GQG7_9NEOP|nr:Synaptic vesicle glycoprotein 2B [Frankliniella fusca]